MARCCALIMNEFPCFQITRLLLREFRPADASAVFDIFSRDEVTRYHNLETMLELAQAEKLVAARASFFQKGVGVRWAVTLQECPDHVIGSCDFFNLNKTARIAELGYDLHTDHWRKDLMIEAVEAAIDYAFNDRFFFPPQPPRGLNLC
jgi:ribosomal-protein-alanine N-acetyltransferase